MASTLIGQFEPVADLPRRGPAGSGFDNGVPVATARQIAERAHEGQVDANGDAYIVHVSRVAAAVPPFAEAVAWLHDVMERSGVNESALTDAGASVDQCLALRLLSRDTGEQGDHAYLVHVRAIALSRGPAGCLARAVKRADLLDHVSHRSTRPDRWTPPYAAAFVILTKGSSSTIPY